MNTELSQDVIEVLDRCLLDIQRGKTIQDCITRYPQYPELGDMLRAATLIQSARRPSMPARQAQLLEQQLLSKFQEKISAQPAVNIVPRRIAPRRWPIRAFLAACAMVVVFFAGAGVIDASDSALPGDSLYGLKRTVEQINVRLSTTDAARNLVYAHMADQRLYEGTLLILQNKPLDAAFIADTNNTLNIVLADNSPPAVQTLLAARAGYLSQLLKQQASQTVAMNQLTASLDRFVAPPISVSPTEAPTLVLSASPLPSVTWTPTNTPTETVTDTPEATQTDTLTDTPEATQTDTFTDTPEATQTDTFTDTPDTTSTPTLTDTPEEPDPSHTPHSAPTDKPHPAHPPTPIPPGSGNGGGNGNGNGGGGNGNGNGNGGGGNGNGGGGKSK
ncbi:MAG: DUF5667 domain-containing protein [Aggregatilineales bacterium]